MIAIDIETYDPNLSTLGPGCIRGDGMIIMVGLYDGSNYVCCKPDDPRLRDWLASSEDKVFHNSIYDLSWLICGYNFVVGGTYHDTMTRCGLINEYMRLDLDTCCKKFHIQGKNYEDTLEAWYSANKKLWGMRGSVWDNVDMLCSTEAGWKILEKYNKQDCVATYNLYMVTEPLIQDQLETYELECKLMPHWIAMKKQGIRVDLTRMERFESELNRLKKLQEQELYNKYQITPDIIASNKKMTIAMDKLDVVSPNKTATGVPSWNNTSLPMIDHPVVPAIMNYKNLEYVAGNKGVQNLRKCLVGDRIHPTIKPTKRDDGGASTARCSCQNPNLQNQSAREDAYNEKAWGPEIRSLFIPEEGCMLSAPDYGQIETRVMAHHAVGIHAEWFREQCRNTKIDMHALAMERTGIKSRHIIKRINFGVPYGMGIRKLVNLDYPMFSKAAKENGYSDVWVYGDALYNQFKQGFPVLFDMMAGIEQNVRLYGYIKDVGNRIHHRPPPALSQYGTWNIPYYKMTAHTIQGGAAQILKRGIANAIDAGVFNVLTMHLTVHDENVVSVPFNKQGIDALNELCSAMSSAFSDRLTVPLPVSCETGPHWGYWKKDITEEMRNGVFDPDAFNRVYAPQVSRKDWVVRNGYAGLDHVLSYKEE